MIHLIFELSRLQDSLVDQIEKSNDGLRSYFFQKKINIVNIWENKEKKKTKKGNLYIEFGLECACLKRNASILCLSPVNWRFYMEFFYWINLKKRNEKKKRKQKRINTVVVSGSSSDSCLEEKSWTIGVGEECVFSGDLDEEEEEVLSKVESLKFKVEAGANRGGSKWEIWGELDGEVGKNCFWGDLGCLVSKSSQFFRNRARTRSSSSKQWVPILWTSRSSPVSYKNNHS